MKKGMKIALWIIGSIIVLTILMNLNSIGKVGCTEINCICGFIERGVDSPGRTEGKCNTCFESNYLFVSVIFNLVQSCEIDEKLICENGKEVDLFLDEENKECQIDPYILVFNLNRLDSYSFDFNREVHSVNGTRIPEGAA